MTKKPCFQFYPADWLNDPALQACSLEAQGLWVSIMCLMHNGNPYGTLTFPNGDKMEIKHISKLLHTHHKTLIKLLYELNKKGVIRVDKNEIYYSKRMQEDEVKRLEYAEKKAKQRSRDFSESPLIVSPTVPNLSSPISSSSSFSSLLTTTTNSPKIRSEVVVVEEKKYIQPIPFGATGKNLFTKDFKYFTITRNGLTRSEKDWIITCLCEMKKLHPEGFPTGYNLDEFLSLHTSCQKTYWRWMDIPISMRMAAYCYVQDYTNATNELTYAVELVAKNGYGADKFMAYVKQAEQWVKDEDFNITYGTTN